MDDPTTYGMRDYSRCDYVRRIRDSLDFDEISEDVKKFGKYKNIKFYITEGPRHQSGVREFIKELLSRKISLLARTNRSNYESSSFQCAGITLIDLSFTVPSWPPEETSLKDFHDIIKSLFLSKKRVAVAIQGYEEGAFIIAFSLMVMGMDRLQALSRIRQFDGEITIFQLQYLRGREEELKAEYRILKNRRSMGFFERCVHFILNAHR